MQDGIWIGICAARLSSPRIELVLAAHLGEHFLDVDVGLTCGPEVADL